MKLHNAKFRDVNLHTQFYTPLRSYIWCRKHVYSGTMAFIFFEGFNSVAPNFRIYLWFYGDKINLLKDSIRSILIRTPGVGLPRWFGSDLNHVGNFTQKSGDHFFSVRKMWETSIFHDSWCFCISTSLLFIRLSQCPPIWNKIK